MIWTTGWGILFGVWRSKQWMRMPMMSASPFGLPQRSAGYSRPVRRFMKTFGQNKGIFQQRRDKHDLAQPASVVSVGGVPQWLFGLRIAISGSRPSLQLLTSHLLLARPDLKEMAALASSHLFLQQNLDGWLGSIRLAHEPIRP
ncbi:hypothetical protein PtB15_9B234 [Puccinia triticina]|nr:hypothetical protein PtB15_9B234 [Puccinia triticina]